MLRPLLALALVALVGCSLTGAGGTDIILDRDGRALSEAELLARLAEADVVIVGEVHDNPVHHRRQARIVRALRPGAVAFEMIPEASEEGIAIFLAEGGRPEDVGPAIGWERMGWPEWRIYRPIFEALGDARIVGGGALRREVRRAVERGAAIAWGPDADSVGLDRALPAPVRAEMEEEMVRAHCDKLPREVAARMVEGQRFRDARLARAVLRARDLAAEAGNARVVLITGNGHARRDRGVPEYLRRISPGLRVLTVGQLELAPGADPGALAREAPFDFVWFSRPQPRPDPCARFG